MLFILIIDIDDASRDYELHHLGRRSVKFLDAISRYDDQFAEHTIRYREYYGYFIILNSDQVEVFRSNKTQSVLDSIVIEANQDRSIEFILLADERLHEVAHRRVYHTNQRHFLQSTLPPRSDARRDKFRREVSDERYEEDDQNDSTSWEVDNCTFSQPFKESVGGVNGPYEDPYGNGNRDDIEESLEEILEVAFHGN